MTVAISQNLCYHKVVFLLDFRTFMGKVLNFFKEITYIENLITDFRV